MTFRGLWAIEHARFCSMEHHLNISQFVTVQRIGGRANIEDICGIGLFSFLFV